LGQNLMGRGHGRILVRKFEHGRSQRAHRIRAKRRLVRANETEPVRTDALAAHLPRPQRLCRVQRQAHQVHEPGRHKHPQRAAALRLWSKAHRLHLQTGVQQGNAHHARGRNVAKDGFEPLHARLNEFLHHDLSVHNGA